MVLPKQNLERAKGKLLRQFYLSMESDLSGLQKIIPWFEYHCGELLVQTIFLPMQIILIEGFTNAVKYAHLNLPTETPIEVFVDIFENLIEIRIWDYGLTFDLEEQVQLEIKMNAEDSTKRESHRGLLLMDSLTDELSYIRENETKNCLIMRRKITRDLHLLF
jgi:serine/threonine-protein kinase RsbW